jgi:xanthine dehydrogenase accessory factor
MWVDPLTLIESAGATVLVEVTGVVGSAPREPGAWMMVAADACAGTIGGGQLEYMAIDHARALLRRGEGSARLDVPLGPEIGQCCGGRVALDLTAVDCGLAGALRRRVETEARAAPEVLVFGAGHVGRALAAALALLPVRAVLIEQRAGELALAPAGVAARLTPLPEAEVAAAGPGAAFVVMTHDHALDFLIAAAALDRGDAAYVGLIGSKSKRARFRAWRRETGARAEGAVRGLVCPIGGASGDKRPAVIAAMAAAEIMAALGATPEPRARTAPQQSEVLKP